MRTGITSWLLVSSMTPLSAAEFHPVDSIHSIQEVVITGTRNETDIRHLPMSISVLERQQIENSYRPSLLPTLAEYVPGLFITGRGILGYGVSTGSAGGMSLRGIGGSPTTGLLVLIDGHPQYMGLMGHPIADAYQSMMAERVEVVRSPASVLYGSNAMGGAINIITRKMRNDGVKTDLRVGYGSYNTLQSEATNRVKAGAFSSIVSGSYNRSDGHRKNMEFDQYGGYAKVGYEINNEWNIWGDINLTHFTATNPGTISAPLLDNDSRITRGMTSLVLQNNYKLTSGAVNFFYNWGRHKINDGYPPDGEPLDYRFNSCDNMLGISWYQSATLFQGNRLTLGFDYLHFGGKAWNRFFNGADKTATNKKQDEVAGYIDMRQAIGEIATIDAGLRVDHHSHAGTEWIPQGGISFHLPDAIELKAMISKGFRFPTIREMYMFPTQNPDLKPERLMSYELSFSQEQLNDALSYGLNLYYINGDNLIMRVPVDGRPKNINTGKVENWGVEIEAAYKINSMWAATFNYSWLHMRYPIIAAPEHKLYGGISLIRGKWNVATGIQYVQNLYTETDPDKKENFILWNLNARYGISKNIDLFVRGENLLAQRYEINAGYPMPKATVIGGINIHF